MLEEEKKASRLERLKTERNREAGRSRRR
ncbi:unnamed protein product [Linum tenue]|uniref:Uncharacterized protein n=1 Tax=Linum tenue TaxID=586396 RepID=A0AAV0KGB1_9ROSI|nr:unnamed protein product [Linum tenue]CAI0420540.1 unnamed protein product [Linum tenue]